MPNCEPATKTEIASLASFIGDKERLLVITGAGCSTESNIPDYRSPTGAYSSGFKPMTHQEFLKTEANQRRYWARSFVGWRRFAEQTAPNDAHRAIATLQHGHNAWRLITQNVDRLHQAAGATEVLELHGSTHDVTCMKCGHLSDRKRLQRQPAVVFFGDSVPRDVALAAKGASEECDGVLVVGSSVSTFSAFRLVRDAHARGVPVAVLTCGWTRVDEMASLKVEKLAGEVLPLVVERLAREDMWGF